MRVALAERSIGADGGRERGELLASSPHHHGGAAIDIGVEELLEARMAR